MALFVLSHLLGDLEGHRVYRRINIVCRDTCLDRDMVCAVQDDLRKVPVAMLLQIEHDVCLDDSGVVQRQLVYLFYYVPSDCFRYREVTTIHSNRNINISSLHGFFLSVGTNPFSGEGLCPLFCFGVTPLLQLHTEALPEIHPAGNRIIDQKFFGALRLHTPFKNQVSPIHNGEGLPHIVVSY